MYDSRSDRATFAGPRFQTATPWHLRHAAGREAPRAKRALKRAASKRDRRSQFPRSQHRGYGWAAQNIKMYFW